jgi:hypothetical protein
MTSINHPESQIMSRAEAGLEVERTKLKPLGFEWLTTAVCAIGIALACLSEVYTLTISLKAKFPALSNGTDLGHEMMALRWGILVVLLLAHALMSERTLANGEPRRGWAHRLRLLPIVGILGGMAIFMSCSTAQVASGGSEHIDLAGYGLGAACGLLFTVSFLAAGVLLGKLTKAISALANGLAQRQDVASIARDIEAADECGTELTTLRREISAKSDPRVLQLKAATEAAGICGRRASDVHDVKVSREAIGKDARPQDTINLPDTPLPVLDQLQTYLKTLDVSFFLNLLQKDA